MLLRLRKKGFHTSKQTINLNFVNFDKIALSDKSFVYFIGYIDDSVRPLYIMLPKISGYVKCFDSGGMNMLIVIKDNGKCR